MTLEPTALTDLTSALVRWPGRRRLAFASPCPLCSISFQGQFFFFCSFQDKELALKFSRSMAKNPRADIGKHLLCLWDSWDCRSSLQKLTSDLSPGQGVGDLLFAEGEAESNISFSGHPDFKTNHRVPFGGNILVALVLSCGRVRSITACFG